MYRRAARRVYRHLVRDIKPVTPPPQPPPFLLDDRHPGRVATFGERNPDVTFYVIWLRRLGCGFFSNLAHVLCHTMLAEAMGMQPVVDFQNFPTLYSEPHPVAGTTNSWEYYFRPISPYSLDEVYESRHVYFCDGWYPKRFSWYVTQIEGARELYDRRVRVRPEIEALALRHSHLFGKKTLGVHYRGQDMNRAGGHPFGATARQITGVAARLVEERGFDRILLATEDEGHLERFRAQFGDLVVATDAFRTRGRLAHLEEPRPRHHYLLGLEVLLDVLLLSRCDGLLAGRSGVSEFATLLHDGAREVDLRIWNGTKDERPFVSLYAWDVRSRLPKWLGGLPGELYDAAACPP